MRPEVSIIIPVFNRCNYVRIMVDSIINQEYKDWELLLVDDGSDEDTIRLLDDYSNNDKRIRFIQRDCLPKGAQTCRNIGLKESTGEYIIFYDSDDWIPEYAVGQRVEYLNAHPELDFAVFPFVSFSAKPMNADGDLRGAVRINQKDLEYFLFSSLPFVVWNNIYRKKALIDKNIRWDEKVKSLQDADFNIHTIQSGLKYDYADNSKVDYYFRTAGGEKDHISMKMRTTEHLNSHLYFLEKELSALPEQWRKKHKRILRWCVYHKFLLAKDCITEEYNKELCAIAKQYDMGVRVKYSIRCYVWMTQKMGIPFRVARYLAFPWYCYSLRKIAEIRYKKVSRFYNRSFV